jgi:hypothetical protein
MDDLDPDSRPAEIGGTRQPGRLRSIALGLLLGCMLGIAGVVAVLAIVRRETLPRIALANVDAAAALWTKNGPADYDFDLEQTGVNPGKIHVEVRKREVTAMTLDGRSTRQHLWDEWSVPGMLDIIRRDVEVCMPELNKKTSQQTADGQGAENAAPEVFPRGVFDAHYGYPVQYRRITPTGADATWRTLKFEAK